MVGSLSWTCQKYSQELFYKKSLLELEIVYSDPFKCYKLFLKIKKKKKKKKKKSHKIFSYNKRYKKDIKKGGDGKRKV